MKHDDPFYPCLEPRAVYRDTCFLQVTSPLLARVDFDLHEAARVCRTAPRIWVEDCFGSLGRDISAIATWRADRAAELCLDVSGQHATRCIIEVARAFENELGSLNPQSLRLCRLARGGRHDCLLTVTTLMRARELDFESQWQACTRLADREVHDACLDGMEREHASR